MNRIQLEHAIRAACDAIDVDTVYVFGSQAILGSHPDAPESLRQSAEVDVCPSPADRDAIGRLNKMHGDEGRFHRTHGFWVHGMPLDDVTLPPGWMDRTIRVQNKNTGGHTGLCLEAHDLAVSKLDAFRHKDRRFVRTLLIHELIDAETLLQRLDGVQLRSRDTEKIRTWVRRTAEELT